MTFAAPLMLIGLAGLAAPVVIHLLDRTRSEVVDWPTLRFLRVARQQAESRSRLRHLLVLAARCLILALIAMAMAMPYQQREQWIKPPELPTTLVIVLDHSYSMGYRPEGGDRSIFDRAKQLALQQIANLSLEDELALVLVNDRAERLTDRPTRDHERVRQLIRGAELSTRPTDLAAGLDAAFALGRLDALDTEAAAPPEADDDGEPTIREPRRVWRQVLLLTDMQLAGWRDALDRDFLATVDRPLPVTVMDLGLDRPINRYVRQVKVRGGGGAATLIAETELAVHGGGITGGQARLWIDGRQVGSPRLLPATGGSVKLSAPMPAPGFHAGIVELDEDRLPTDDRAFFSLTIGGGRRLFVVDGDPSDVPRFSETYYLDAALDVLAARGGTLDVTRLTPEQLSTTDLPPGAAVVLANVPRLDGSALVRIENLLRSGGNVFIALGDQVDIQHYNRDWRFLPLALTRPLGRPERQRAYGINVVAEDHPLFEGAIDLSATRYFAFIGTDPTTLGESGEVIATFSNGSPAIMEGKYGGAAGGGGGRVVLLTGPVDSDWSNLPFRRVFLPLVDRLVGHLTRQRLTARSIAVGRPIRFTGPATLSGSPIVVTAPGGATRRITAVRTDAGDEAAAVFTETDELGIYRVEADPGFAAGGAFAVNLDPGESVLAPADAAAIREAFGEHPVRMIERPPGKLGDWYAAARQQEDRRVAYWPWLLAAAFVLFALEAVLANFFTRRPTTTAPPTTQYVGRMR